MNGLGLQTPQRRSMPASSSQSGRLTRKGRGHRHAFTLVELLVVIVIIGILIALLVPTIGSAMRAARVARVGLEMNGLVQALERYRSDMSAYPPDFAGDQVFDAEQVRKHLARKFRNSTEAPAAIAQGVAGLDPAEALVFWLSGFSKNVRLPLSARTSPDPGVWNKFKGDSPYFEFVQERLIDSDGDGYPEYYPPDSERPYVYISSSSYLNLAGEVNNIQVATGGPNQRLVHAYAAELNGLAVKRFADAEKYQILCAGSDGEFHDQGGSLITEFPAGTGYGDADEDNIASFSGGKTLEDSIP